jgi:hypothetical protein
MTDIEIPIGKRTKRYRFFEILPGALSYGVVIAVVVTSFFDPMVAAGLILLIVCMMFAKSMGMAVSAIRGSYNLKRAQKVNWSEYLQDLEDPEAALLKRGEKMLHSRQFAARQHVLNLDTVSEAKGEFPRPHEIYHAVIIALYQEGYEIIKPTLQALVDSDYDSKRLIVTIAYEQRGGEAALKTVRAAQKHFGHKFHSFLAFEHPDKLPNEVVGKGANITFGGQGVARFLAKEGIDPKNVIVTTLDCDNIVSPNYFSYLTYEWVVSPNRQRLSFQPVCVFSNNIWDVPAPARVIATGNSFWNIISYMRPHSLRNFASHAQGMAGLIAMNFWSTRTIVEDGHQYWRSYFHFDGDYAVKPMHVAVGQDAVLSGSYVKTLKAQFSQLARWAYGCSDEAYVANNLLRKDRKVRLIPGWSRFLRLLEGHVSQSYVALVVAIGGWIPLFLNSEAARSYSAHQLPIVIGQIQQIAIVGIIVTIFLSFKILPPRPAQYKKSRNILMVLQWVIMPVTAILYASLSAFYSQTRLMLGRYMEVFKVTPKFVKAKIKR